MNEHFENINPWAEKLQQVAIPDVAGPWLAMEALLDAEMPVAKSRDWRRWLLLIILLLLLIGVCNCPGALRLSRFAGKQPDAPVNNQPEYNKNEAKTKTNPSANKISSSIKMKNGSKAENAGPVGIVNDAKKTNDKNETVNKNTVSKIPDSISVKKTDLISGNDQVLSKKGTRNSVKERTGNDSLISGSIKKIKQDPGNHNKKKYLSGDDEKTANTSVTDQKGNKPVKHDVIRKNNKEKEQGINEATGQDSVTVKNDSSKIKNSIGNISSDSLKKIAKTDSLKKKQQIIAKQKMDSVAKKVIKADSIEEAKGFLFALGLNQFFPVGNQEKSNFNSSGTSGNLADYIPVPVARYYFHKWLYIQAEAQFNAPQYTKTLLANQSVASNPSGQDTSKSVFIKKLFYFNIPLSVHFSPFKNLYIGAGLQYSMLTNGVALFQDAKETGQGPIVLPANDTFLISSKIRNFKNDPVYHQLKTYEFRFLIDINYQWKPLTLGLRYNQAFTNFINVHISNTVITQAHNSSLQLYLRYTIWDHRKKWLLPK